MNREHPHTISILVNNQPGALIRVAQVFTRRAFNINSINVSPTLDDRYSHMTITATGDPDTVRQIVLQLEKLIDVLHAVEHSTKQTTRRELALVKVTTNDHEQLKSFDSPEVNSLVVEELKDHAILQLTGDSIDIDRAIITLKADYTIVELLRTGVIGMTHANIIET